MKDNFDTLSIEHNFKNIEKAKKILNEWGYSLNNSFIEIHYLVYPMGRGDDYPLVKGSEIPRPIAVVNPEGILSIRKPKDNNPILIEHQEELRDLVSKLRVH